MGLRGRSKFVDKKCFFITTTCNGFKNLFKDERYYQTLKDSLLFLNNKYHGELLAYVFMPNHIHLVLNFKKENYLSVYMRDFKKYTSFKIRKLIEIDGRINLLNSIKYEQGKQKFKVWHDRFDDVYIEDEDLLATKIEYIHLNPLRAKLVKYPEDYKYSSAYTYGNIDHNDPLIDTYES